MRKLSLHHTLFAASLLPLIALCALLFPQNLLVALTPHTLPETSVDLALSCAPFLVAILFDRNVAPHVKHALISTLTMASSAFALVCICSQLYPPQVEVADSFLPIVLTTFATTGIVLGARSSGLRPGIASGVILALYSLPPLLMLLSATIAQTPSNLLRSVSPLWAWQSDSQSAWGFVILGAAGLASASLREWLRCRRISQKIAVRKLARS